MLYLGSETGKPVLVHYSEELLDEMYVGVPLVCEMCIMFTSYDTDSSCCPQPYTDLFLR